MRPEDIIIAPVITEKSNDELQAGKYTFRVNKKATKTELTETQKENLVLANEIYEWLLENVNGKTSKDIANHFGKSSQKITPIMKKLIDDEKVSFTVEKKVKVFKAISQD